MNPTLKASADAAGVVPIGSAAMISIAAHQTLENPSAAAVASPGLIVVHRIVGIAGMAAFGALALLRNGKTELGKR